MTTPSSSDQKSGSRRLLFRLSLALNLLAVIAAIVLVVRRTQRSIEPGTPSPARRSLLAMLPVKADHVVMLGDSLTERCEWAELMGSNRLVNRGIGWDTTKDVHARLPAILAGKPSQVVIMVGINDLHGGLRPDAVLALYRAMLEEATKHQPAPKVVVQSVLPVRASRISGNIDNADIAQLNEGLRKLAGELGAQFADVAAAVRDDQGALAAELTVDGVHLTGEGYQAWARVLRPHLVTR